MALQLIDKSPEARLMQTLDSKPLQSDGWTAIHFHLSDLLDEYKSEYQIKIAVNLIHGLLKNYVGSIFLMGDLSIMVMCYQIDSNIKEKLIFQLRYLFMDDPLAYAESGQENPEFCTIYELRRDWKKFFELCSHRMVMASRKTAHPERYEYKSYSLRPAALERLERPSTIHAPQANESELSASTLALIENNLQMADIQSAIRRQPVCAVLPDNRIRRVFDELYMNIAYLRRLLKSDIDFLSNRWLFKYMTRTLDERMIGLLREKPRQYLETPISINVNVETLLSSWFAEFDASIPSAGKVSIVLEIPVIDVFADMEAFILARKEVQKLGYRVCLDGLTTASFTSINREALGVDLIKMQWNADNDRDLKSNESQALIKAVQSTGTNRLILCRCDNKRAIEYGQALGISLYQGRYLDGLLDPTSKVEN